jgi:hypothetical protein
MRLIDQQFLRTPFYGSRRMTASLERSGEVVNRKRVQRLMAKMGLEAIFPRPRTTIAATAARVYCPPLSDRLAAGIRFLPRPLPAAPWTPLASRLPVRGGQRAYHVPPMCRGGEGRRFSPVVRHLRRGRYEPPDLTTCRFGPSVSASSSC